MKLNTTFVFIFLAFLNIGYSQSVKISDQNLQGKRFLTFNVIIRVNQIEITRDSSIGKDERYKHTPERVIAFRKAIEDGFPGGKISWALSWRALNDTTSNYRLIRELIIGYHYHYGDEVTFLPGAYFSNAHNSRAQVNRDLHDGLLRLSEIVGNNYRPKAIIAGFLAADNQKYLAEKEGIHVCQGNIWSQYAIDNQDGEGSVCYPYYPSTEHFCKPAQSKSDFIDCVNLDGWTMDFLAARREGLTGGFNSRLGVGPIETLGAFGEQIGLKEMMHTTASHFDSGFELNNFAWVTNNWELALRIPLSGLTQWLRQIRSRWPDTKFITMGEYGSLWRKQFKSNSFNYRFKERGSGIGGSDIDMEIRWFMNKNFRLALLRDWKRNTHDQVIDFTRYDYPAKEPDQLTRNWSLLGIINQKQTRKGDKPIFLSELSTRDKQLIKKWYPKLFVPK